MSDPGADSAMHWEAQQPTAEWHVLRNDSSVIVFDSGDTMHMPATRLRMLEKLRSPLGRLWYLFSGRDSAVRNESLSLYVFSPDGSMGQGIQKAWNMSGKMMDHGGTETYYEAEVFTGEVFPDTVGVVWYDRSLMPDGQWRLNTTLLDLNGPEPDTLVLFGHARKSTTQALAFKGRCNVLKAVDQTVKP